MVIKCTILFYLLSACLAVSAQKLDSIYFNLYTDSLKRGTYNYINLEGHYSDGRYLPLGPKEVTFSSDAGKFEGNSLFIDTSFKSEKVTVKVVVNGNALMSKEITIYIKKLENTERLPSMDEIMHPPSSDPGSSKNRRRR
ncbi:MAG: hypothetical protein ABI415_04975 [Flavitalea sp.]